MNQTATGPGDRPRGNGVRRIVRSAAAMLPNPSGLVVNATMLGSTGVGKTSLLAAMSDRFENLESDSDLDILADHDTSLQLGNAVGLLRQLPQSVAVRAALPGNQRVRRYEFGVGVRGRRSSFTLTFTDYPGAYFVKAEYPDKNIVEKALRDSDVLLLAIDAPAMMYHDGDYHDFVNQTDAVYGEIRRLLSDTTEPRLLILAILKCESYVTDAESTARLIEAIKKRYAKILEFIAGDELRDRVGCVITPVQTVGTVRFLEVQVVDGEPEFHFRALDRNSVYAPVDTEQPLRYLMRFVLNKYRSERRPLYKTIFETAVGTDGRLVRAIEKFAGDSKVGDGFVVVQDHPYLHAPVISPSRRSTRERKR